jgi:hypothetical protein
VLVVDVGTPAAGVSVVDVKSEVHGRAFLGHVRIGSTRVAGRSNAEVDSFGGLGNDASQRLASAAIRSVPASSRFSQVIRWWSVDRTPGALLHLSHQT